MFCECGNKTNNKNGVCDSCRVKIKLLNQIREIFEPKKEIPKSKIKRSEKKKKYYSQKNHSTLCWNCKNACGGCSWSRDFVPVKGWSAEPSKVLIASAKQTPDGKPKYTGSFDVYYCPQFDMLDMLK